MINFKQIELGKVLFEKLANQFPEIRLVNISESVENPNHIWVNIIMLENDDREIEIRQTASEISTDILLEYGYHITISSAEEIAPIDVRQNAA